MKVDIVINSDGKGLWSDEVRTVNLVKLKIGYINEDLTFGELRAYFTKSSWNTDKHGLIYTDQRWMREFLSALRMDYGFTRSATSDISYSEQGMQGDDYVSMDIGTKFLTEWCKKNSKESTKPGWR